MNFSLIARRASEMLGSAKAFFAATLSIVVWALAGPFLGFSEVWQLTINTATTIITFLAVFLIQHAQNADTRAIHIKLDELIAKGEADNQFTRIEREDSETLDRLDYLHDEAV